MKILNLLTLGTLTLIVACAPALSAGDPVFATGQVWRVNWGDNTTSELTVPILADARNGMFNYTGKFMEDGVQKNTWFWYDPVDSDPEFIHFQVTNPNTREMKHCFIRNPGKITVNQTAKGLYLADNIVENMQSYYSKANKYITTGDTDGQPSCSVTRLS